MQMNSDYASILENWEKPTSFPVDSPSRQLFTDCVMVIQMAVRKVRTSMNDIDYHLGVTRLDASSIRPCL